MSKDDHKIDADDRTVFDVLNERKFTVDYFQRPRKFFSVKGSDRWLGS